MAEDDSDPTESVPRFISNLYSIVSNKNVACIKWDDKGDCVVIHDPAELMDYLVKNRYITSNKYPSLVRQLNMYGFSKCTEAHTFKHVSFKRNQPELLSLINRRHLMIDMVPVLVKRQAVLEKQVVSLVNRIRQLEETLISCLQHLDVDQSGIKTETLDLSALDALYTGSSLSPTAISDDEFILGL